jgi:hypothetical protein
MLPLYYSIKSIQNLLNYIPLTNLQKKDPLFNKTMSGCVKRAIAALSKLPQETPRDTELFTQDVCDACDKFREIKDLFERHIRTSLFNRDTKKECRLLIYNLSRLNRFYNSTYSVFEQYAPHYIAWKYEEQEHDVEIVDLSTLIEEAPDAPEDIDEQHADLLNVSSLDPLPGSKDTSSLTTPLLRKSEGAYESYAAYMRKNTSVQG